MTVFFPSNLTHLPTSGGHYLVDFHPLYRTRWKMLSTSNLLPKIFHEDALLNPCKNCYFTFFCPFFKHIHIHLQVQFVSVNHNTVFHLYRNISCLQWSRFYIYLIFKQYRLVSVAALCSWNAAIVNQHEQRIASLKVGRFWYCYHSINLV